jgi:hypothetical protein
MTATLTQTDQLLAESAQNRAQLRVATDNLTNSFPNTAKGRQMRERARLMIELNEHRTSINEMLDRFAVTMSALFATYSNEH